MSKINHGAIFDRPVSRALLITGILCKTGHAIGNYLSAGYPVWAPPNVTALVLELEILPYFKILTMINKFN